ncbi:hypothetical protein [Marinomonas sp.]|uniref:hypothetical protein n=1 Tax=Marinomonas sp. TaxID=1904862 RepID=UPI003BA948A1
MNWLDAVVKLIDNLVWPIVILIVFFSLRSEFAKLLGRITKLSHKDSVVELSEERIMELAFEKRDEIEKLQQVGNDDSIRPVSETESYLRDVYRELLYFAESDPSRSIWNAFFHIRKAGKLAVLRHSPKLDEKLIRSDQNILKYLRKFQILDTEEAKQFSELCELKSKALHGAGISSENHEIGSRVATNYAELSVLILRTLNEHKP